MSRRPAIKKRPLNAEYRDAQADKNRSIKAADDAMEWKIDDTWPDTAGAAKVLKDGEQGWDNENLMGIASTLRKIRTAKGKNAALQAAKKKQP